MHARAGVVRRGVVAFHAGREVEDAAGSDAHVGEHGASVRGHAVEGGGVAKRGERVLAVGEAHEPGRVRAAEDGGDDVGAVSVAVLGVAEGGDVGVDFTVVGTGGSAEGVAEETRLEVEAGVANAHELTRAAKARGPQGARRTVARASGGGERGKVDPATRLDHRGRLHIRRAKRGGDVARRRGERRGV